MTVHLPCFRIVRIVLLSLGIYARKSVKLHSILQNFTVCYTMAQKNDRPHLGRKNSTSHTSSRANDGIARTGRTTLGQSGSDSPMAASSLRSSLEPNDSRSTYSPTPRSSSSKRKQRASARGSHSPLIQNRSPTSRRALRPRSSSSSKRKQRAGARGSHRTHQVTPRSRSRSHSPRAPTHPNRSLSPTDSKPLNQRKSAKSGATPIVSLLSSDEETKTRKVETVSSRRPRSLVRDDSDEAKVPIVLSSDSDEANNNTEYQLMVLFICSLGITL